MRETFTLFLTCIASSYSLGGDCNVKYCLRRSLNSVVVKIHEAFEQPATKTGLHFPDDDFYSLLHSNYLHESQVTTLGISSSQ